MRPRTNRACAPRARDARTLLACALVAVTLTTAVAARALTKPQDNSNNAANAAASVVGAWHATLPNGLRVATLAIVPAGEGFAGAFVGYDYSGPVDFKKPVERTPKVSMRSGSLLSGTRLDGNTLTFKIHLRHPSPPEGRPPGYDVAGEVRIQGGDNAELRLTAPHKPEPMILKLTRE